MRLELRFMKENFSQNFNVAYQSKQTAGMLVFLEGSYRKVERLQYLSVEGYYGISPKANLLSEQSAVKLCQLNGFGDTETASSAK